MTSLESAKTPDKILEILLILEKKVEPTEELLRETKLGIAVNKFRSHPSQSVSDKVKKIIQKWKVTVTSQKHKKVANNKELGSKHSNSNSTQPQQTASSTTSGGSGGVSSTNNKPSVATAATTAGAAGSGGVGTKINNGQPRSAKTDGIRTDVHADKVRNSCIEVCYNSLVMDTDIAPDTVLTIAKGIEQVVFNGEKGVTATYRTKMRSLCVNLKDKKNPMLRSRVVLGEISPERLYTMTPQEMASDELKVEIKELEKKNLFNAQGAKEKRATTDRFTCGKCKHKKVSYYQMQTRSADEPLTTFCTCENCGNRWKFC